MGGARTQFFAQLAGERDSLIKRTVARILDELDGFHLPDPAFESVLGDVVGMGFDHLTRLWEDDRTLTDDEAAAVIATGLPQPERGISLGETLHAHRIAGEVVWETFQSVSARFPDLDRDLIIRCAAIGFDYLNVVSAGITRRHMERERHREQWRAEVERRLVDDLLHVPARLHEAAQAARELDVNLQGRWQAVVLVPRDGRSLTAAAEEVRARLTTTVDAAVVAPHGEVVVVLVARKAADAENVDRLPDVIVGMGRATTGPRGIRRSYDDAVQAVEIARRRDVSRLHADDVWLERLLLGMVSAEEVAEVFLAPLDDLDEGQRAMAEESLEAYLDGNCSVTAAAEMLYLHPQSFRYRLKKLRGIFGDMLEDRDTRLLLHVAIKQRALGTAGVELPSVAEIEVTA